MADNTPDARYLPLMVTVPAGTAKATPQVTSFDPGRVFLDEIQVRIPAGPSGLSGFGVRYDGQGIVPWAFPPDFFVGDNEQPRFDVNMFIGHALQIVAYNTGSWDHKYWFRFRVRDLVDAAGDGAAAGIVAQVL